MSEILTLKKKNKREREKVSYMNISIVKWKNISPPTQRHKHQLDTNDLQNYTKDNVAADFTDYKRTQPSPPPPPLHYFSLPIPSPCPTSLPKTSSTSWPTPYPPILALRNFRQIIFTFITLKEEHNTSKTPEKSAAFNYFVWYVTVFSICYIWYSHSTGL